MKTPHFFYAPDPDDTASTDSSSGTSDDFSSDSTSSSDDSSDGSSDVTADDTTSTDDSSNDDSSNDGSSDDVTADDTSSTGDSSSDDSSADDTTSSDDSSSDASTDNDASSADDPSGDTSTDTSTMEDTVDTSTDSASTTDDTSSAGISAPVRPYSVESWRDLVTQFADDMPVEVLLRWIKHESGGNPCSTGKIVNGASIENGLFQLYHPDDDHFASPAQLHGSFCSGQTCTRDLTSDEAKIQVTSGIAYVKSCRERARAQLQKAGVTWDESGSDFWSLVKMQHNLPGIPAKYIPALKPSSWEEFKNGVIAKEPKYKGSSIFSNAEDIGSAA